MGQSVEIKIKELQREVEHLKEERRHTADRIAASMRLTAIGQLAAGVAHELNNPLSVILGFSQSLSRQHENEEALYTSLKTVEREATRCRRLVQDLLNFARLPKPGKVKEDVVQVLDGALSLVEAQARIQHVELVRQYTGELPMVFLDRHKIQQAVINLCINAIDAMPKGGRLTIHARPILVEPDKTPAVEICVGDTGIGISPDIREHIFEPFFTTKAPGKGTGLGLSLVREIVRDHDSRLELISEPGRGTTFYIRLPANSRPALPHPNVPQRPESGV